MIRTLKTLLQSPAKFCVTSGLGFRSDELSLYGLGTLRPISESINFLSQYQLETIVRPLLNSSHQRHTLEDKWIVAHYTNGVRIPSPRTIALWINNSGIAFTGEMLKDASALKELLNGLGNPDLVLKPRGGRQGRDVILARIESTYPIYKFRMSDDSVLTFEQLIAGLNRDRFLDYGGGYIGWLIQERISQHSALAEINPHAVNSVRIVTLKRSDSEVTILGALMRIGRRGSAADNWAQGGLSVGIDLCTGKLSRGVFKPKFGGEWTSVHPETGVEFTGQKVPYWLECIDLSRRAAEAYSGVGTVGWDIAVTTEGPVLMEGNADWDLPMLQIHTEGLLAGSLRDELEKRATQLPKELPPTHSVIASAAKAKVSNAVQLFAKHLEART